MGNCSSDEARGRGKLVARSQQKDYLPLFSSDETKPEISTKDATNLVAVPATVPAAVPEVVPHGAAPPPVADDSVPDESETEVDKLARIFDRSDFQCTTSQNYYEYFAVNFPENGIELEILKQLSKTARKNIFWAAVTVGHKKTVSIMLEEWPKLVHFKNAHGVTPLMTAAGFFYPDIVKILIAAGADVNAVTVAIGNWDPLSFAIIPFEMVDNTNLPGKEPARVEIVKMLIDAGADAKRMLYTDDGRKTTHLMAAVNNTREFGSTKVVEILLPLSNIEEINTVEQTALFIAVINIFEYSTAGTLELLLDHGAKITKYDSDGRYPYQYAEGIEDFPPQLLERLRFPSSRDQRS